MTSLGTFKPKMSNALGQSTSLCLNRSMNLEVFDKVVVTQERKRIENK